MGGGEGSRGWGWEGLEGWVSVVWGELVWGRGGGREGVEVLGFGERYRNGGEMGKEWI